MRIVNLKLLNFRNYNHLTLSFSPNINVIYGKNGSGKTNLIEAIYVLGLTKSFRSSTDKVLVMKDKNLTKISGVVFDNINKEYQLTISGDGKVAKIDSHRQNKLSDYIAKVNIILFHPDSLKVIKDSPSIRRDNLNIDMSQFDNEFINLLNDYEKVLKQRNAYLKVMYANANKSQVYLDILTDKLIDYGLKIFEKRTNFIEQINKYIGNFYSKISGIGTLKIKYQSELKDKNQEKLKKMYNSLKDKDMLLGNTTLGVHKDDYAFCFESESLKDYASQGQQKNAIIAYKLSLIELFKNERNIKPILILDDLFSELDNEKINNILEVIDKDLQIFITVTDLNKLPSYIKDKDNKIFNCEFGEIREDI